MAAPLTSSQSSLASQLLQISIATRPSPCGSGLARDGGAADFRQSSLASQLLQKGIAICPLPLWERACPRWQRHWFQDRARWQASSYRKASQSAPSSCGSGLARDDDAADFKAELAGKPAPTEKQHRNLPAPPVGAGLPAMAALLSSSQLLQKASISTCYFSQHLHQGLPACGAFAARRSAGFQFKTGSLLHIGDEPLTLGVNCSRSR